MINSHEKNFFANVFPNYVSALFFSAGSSAMEYSYCLTSRCIHLEYCQFFPELWLWCLYGEVRVGAKSLGEF